MKLPNANQYNTPIKQPSANTLIKGSLSSSEEMVFLTLVMLHHSGCFMSEQSTLHSVVGSPAGVWLDNV